MNKIGINEYILLDSKLKVSRTVASISDIHGNIKALKNVSTILKQLKIRNTFIEGDILDNIEDRNKDEIFEELNNLSKSTQIYVSLGNHDMFWYDKDRKHISDSIYKEVFDELKSTNCIVFIEKYGNCILDKDIVVNALNIPFSYYEIKEDNNYFKKWLSSITPNIDKDKFNILLNHSPNSIIEKDRIIDYNKMINEMNLILSGHNHGGLTPKFIQNIPNFHYGLIGPYAKIIKRNAYGYFTKQDTSLIISNGITKVSTSSEVGSIGKIINMFFHPEIDIIHLEPSDKHLVKLKSRRNI